MGPVWGDGVYDDDCDYDCKWYKDESIAMFTFIYDDEDEGSDIYGGEYDTSRYQRLGKDMLLIRLLRYLYLIDGGISMRVR
jgi:hypothetical protein